MKYPKGSMCLNCTSLHKDCSNLPFDKYPACNKDGEVICKSYTKESLKRFETYPKQAGVNHLIQFIESWR